MPSRRTALVVAVLLASSSCGIARYPRPPFDEAYVAKWLPPVDDGATTRSEIYQVWGAPTRLYEDGRITAYRIILAESGSELSEYEYRQRLAELSSEYRPLFFPEADFDCKDVGRLAQHRALVVVTADNRANLRKRLITRPGEYSLVVVFDSRGVVRRHSMTRVHP